MSTELAEAVGALPLVDHHAHSTLREVSSLAEFAPLFTESDRPTPSTIPALDSQLGFAVRRHCGQLLGLANDCSADDYWSARSRFEEPEIDRVFLRAAGVARWLIDTGHGGDELLEPAEFSQRVPDSSVHHVARLESILESVAAESDAATLQDRFTTALFDAASSAVGLKSIVAYRHGFNFDPTPPSTVAVREAAGRWLSQLKPGNHPRVEDPVLLRMALWAGVDTGLPIQMHVGLGDPDIDLRLSNPLRLRTWLTLVEPLGVNVVLLHCYPFHREAGYLAHCYPHVSLDVGLAINFTGARSPAIIAEAMELAPFRQVLYSSDAWGAPELHYLGAFLWRQGITRTLNEWVTEGSWTLPDAIRVADMIGRGNAGRIYGLNDG